MYFVDFLRPPKVDEETGETVDANPSYYESPVDSLQMVKAMADKPGDVQRDEQDPEAGPGSLRRCAKAHDAHIEAAMHGARQRPAGWCRRLR